MKIKKTTKNTERTYLDYLEYTLLKSAVRSLYKMQNQFQYFLKFLHVDCSCSVASFTPPPAPCTRTIPYKPLS